MVMRQSNMQSLFFRNILLALILPYCFIASCTSWAKGDEIFDFNHIKYSLIYLENPTAENFANVANSQAMQHLKNHSDRTGYYSKESTPEEIAKDLLASDEINQNFVNEAKQLLTYAQNSKDEQSYCTSKTKEYLPHNFKFDGKLYFTWGYDIGVSMDQNASLNLIHKKFREDAEEIWFYCIHELHHIGVQHFTRFPDLSTIQTGNDLFALVKYLTFLEGSAVYASYEARQRNNALDDPDYIALEDSEIMDKYHREYFEIYEKVRLIGKRNLDDEDWNLLNNLSDGKRLWYRVGAKIAAEIDASLGRTKLNLLIQSGPDAFFDAYFDLNKSNGHKEQKNS
jgi:hypothetical protein